MLVMVAIFIIVIPVTLEIPQMTDDLPFTYFKLIHYLVICF